MPTDERTPERDERLVNIGSLVVADAQAPKLIQPGERALDHPPPPAQAGPMFTAPFGEARHDVPQSETAPDRGRIVAAITEHTVWPPPRSPAFALESGNRIHVVGFCALLMRPSRLVHVAIVLKSWGCPRIAQQITLAFGIPINKDVVRRILAVRYTPKPDADGPSLAHGAGSCEGLGHGRF
jgi:hypothetical protein